jgi:surfeit locus 1 family protein
MSGTGSRILLPAVLTFAGFMVLLGLGTWQLERKAWKEALIATLEQRLGDAPETLPPPAQWAGMTAENSEFQRVRVRITAPAGGDVLVFTGGSALRDDIKAPGYFVFSPVKLSDGSTIVINRGYVPDKNYPPFGPQEIVGTLRWPEAPSWFVAEHDAAGTLWYARDPGAMAELRGWGPVAPFYVEMEGPVPAGGMPHPAPLKVRLRNEHLQYAFTWYGLAAVLAAMSAIWLSRWRRRTASG